MECLMCGKDKSSHSWLDLLKYEDPLCVECRNAWKKDKLECHFEGFPLYSPYLYNDAFSSCLIQYKECFDEALYPIFLYEEKKYIEKKYKGYTLCFMPSSKKKEKERGFSHLEKIFSIIDMPKISPFINKQDSSQKGKTSKERKEMIHNLVLKEDIYSYSKLLLVDDVITTGSTLSAAIKELYPIHQNIEIYTISHTEKWKK